MNRDEKVRDILEELYHHNIDFEFAFSQLNAIYKPITREYFHYVMCEYPPTIAQDSGQPEWASGELDKAYDDLVVGNGPWSSMWRKKNGK